jgi:hypothetical protein
MLGNIREELVGAPFAAKAWRAELVLLKQPMRGVEAALQWVAFRPIQDIQPPATSTMLPAIKLAAGLPRKRTTAAISAGSPRRPVATLLSCTRICSGLTASLMGELMMPGAIAFTRMLSGASAFAMLRVNPITAAFEVP